MILRYSRALAGILIVTMAGIIPATSHSADRTLSVSVAAIAPVGQPLTVRVDGARQGDSVTLVAVGSLGTWLGSLTAAGGTASIIVPVSFTRVAGVTSFVVRDNDASATAATTLTPGPEVGPVQPVVGARSIVADGTDRSMVVAIPVDRWGNAVDSGTAISFFRRDVAGATESSDVLSAHLIAWREFSSGTIAGRDFVWTSLHGAAGQRVDLEEVAGTPEPFTLLVVSPSSLRTLFADGRSLVAVQTSVLADRFGNVEPDGTEVILRFEGPNGRGQASAETISGVARLSLQAPSTPGALTVTASSRGVAASSTFVLRFAVVVT